MRNKNYKESVKLINENINLIIRVKQKVVAIETKIKYKKILRINSEEIKSAEEVLKKYKLKLEKHEKKMDDTLRFLVRTLKEIEVVKVKK